MSRRKRRGGWSIPRSTSPSSRCPMRRWSRPSRRRFDPEGAARYRVLALHGEIEGKVPTERHSVEYGGALVDLRELAPKDWSYVALGHYHVQHKVAPQRLVRRIAGVRRTQHLGPARRRGGEGKARQGLAAGRPRHREGLAGGSRARAAHHRPGAGARRGPRRRRDRQADRGAAPRHPRRRGRPDRPAQGLRRAPPRGARAGPRRDPRLQGRGAAPESRHPPPRASPHRRRRRAGPAADAARAGPRLSQRPAAPRRPRPRSVRPARRKRSWIRSSATWPAPDADRPAFTSGTSASTRTRSWSSAWASPGSSGPNGAGKTTILEAIAWAMYGMPAARGSRDTIRRRGAAPRDRVEVEMDFTLGPHHYRVVRSLNGAQLYQDGESAPVANSLGSVTDRVTRLLGMSRDEFFNTYFTGQKELAVMAAMTAPERAQFLSRVLGYDRLRVAQERLKEKRSALRARLDALRASLGDPAELEAGRAAGPRAARRRHRRGDRDRRGLGRRRAPARRAASEGRAAAAAAGRRAPARGGDPGRRPRGILRRGARRAAGEAGRRGRRRRRPARRGRPAARPAARACARKATAFEALAEAHARRQGLIAQLADVRKHLASVEERAGRLPTATAVEAARLKTQELRAALTVAGPRRGECADRLGARRAGRADQAPGPARSLSRAARPAASAGARRPRGRLPHLHPAARRRVRQRHGTARPPDGGSRLQRQLLQAADRAAPGRAAGAGGAGPPPGGAWRRSCRTRRRSWAGWRRSSRRRSRWDRSAGVCWRA